MIWGEAGWPEIDGLDREAVALLPTGSLEQHGPHLPLLTDAMIAEAFGRDAESRLPRQVLLLPAIWLGASAHHLAFAGTLSASFEGYQEAVLAIGRSLRAHGFRKLFILNGHGGNTSLNDLACRRLREEVPAFIAGHAGWFDFASDTLWEEVLEGRERRIRHADEAETSLMLHLRPDLVRMDCAVDDGLASSVPGIAWRFDEITDHGVLGQATLASAEKGARIFRDCSVGLISALERLAAGPTLQGPVD